MLEWLEACCSDPHLQQVFWEARQRTHLLCAACFTGPTTICNRSTDDAIAFTLHTALSHLENKNTYVRMLFVDYSSAFNTIVPATLVAKPQTLGLNRSLCSWILDFLTGRSQVVRMGNNTSSPLILNTGASQGCVLSPLLYSLYTQGVHTWLYSYTQLQCHRQICWRHNGDRPDHRQRWDGLQRGGECPD